MLFQISNVKGQKQYRQVKP